MSLNDIIKDNKEEILKGINKQIVDFLEQQSDYNSHFYIVYEQYFNDFVVSAIKHYIIENFSIQVFEVYDQLNKEYLIELTDNYFFDKLNYKDEV